MYSDPGMNDAGAHMTNTDLPRKIPSQQRKDQKVIEHGPEHHVLTPLTVPDQSALHLEPDLGKEERISHAGESSPQYK